MPIQPLGSLTLSFLPPVNDDVTASRNNIQVAGGGTTPPVATQTPHAVPQASQVASTSPDATPKGELEKHLSKINDFVQTRASNVQFVTDEETGIRIVKVVDTATKEVVRQLPTEEAVRIAKALDQLQGLLIRQKA